ncbi:MAG: glycyl-radical enzyme activating protein [Spirochaetia bacterium]|nr:glycyl-radical enzyme activating protein [Spirochaetia bacterium]
MERPARETAQSGQAERGLVFNIQRYSIHDGPGIRTIVFLKGCPLRCKWCSNPEGMDFFPVLSYNKSMCRKCGRCVGLCPRGALGLADTKDRVVIQRASCDCCGECAAACPADALKVFGKSMSAREVLDDVAKDAAFYRRSGGGLTLGGGEPLASPGFARALLERAKKDHGLDTAMETSFFAPPGIVDKITQFVDHLLVDIKLADSSRHREAAGVDNGLILDNIRRAAAQRPAGTMLLRFPMIPGVNDDGENISAVAEFITGLPQGLPLEVLPYHEFGRGKFGNLDREYPLAGCGMAAPGKESVEALEEVFRRKGVRVVHS